MSLLQSRLCKGSIKSNTFVGLGGEAAKKKKKNPISQRRKEGRVEKKSAQQAWGVEPETCRMLGEGRQLHAMGVV